MHQFWATRVFPFPQKCASQGLTVLCIKMLDLQGGMELKLNVKKFIKSVKINKKILYDFWTKFYDGLPSSRYLEDWSVWKIHRTEINKGPGFYHSELISRISFGRIAISGLQSERKKSDLNSYSWENFTGQIFQFSGKKN